MTKNKDYIQEEERGIVRSFHNATSKGRVKQTEKKLTMEYDSFDEWDENPIETFQKFNKRGSR